MKNYKLPKNKVLVLRTCNNDLTSYNNFQWPESGVVKCPDWKPKPECGNGLHGLLWGEGNGQLLNWSQDAKWLVVEVDEKDIVSIDDDKVKFPKGKVVYCGNKEEATNLIHQHAPNGKAIVGLTVAVGDNRTATAGDNGTATAGYEGTATAGKWGTATAGYGGTATAGDDGTATAGDDGTATAGDGGTATAGNCGTATAGDRGTATAGYKGTATAGNCGTATAGYEGTIQIKYWDDKKERHRIKIGYIEEDGLKPNVKYKLNDKHNFIEVKE